MAIDPPVDDEAGADDRRVETSLGQALRVEGDLERTRDLELVDQARADPEPGDPPEERVPTPVDDLLVPVDWTKARRTGRPATSRFAPCIRPPFTVPTGATHEA